MKLRKLTERQQKGNAARKQMLEHLESLGGWVSLKQLEADLGITISAAHHHATALENEGLIVKEKRVLPNSVKTTAIFVRTVASLPEGYVPEEVPERVLVKTDDNTPSHVRVVRLLDNPLPKPEEPKKKTKVYVGSGMSLFNNY